MKKICKVCQNEFECYDEPKIRSRRIKGKRPFGSLTCSPTHSREYCRNWHKYNKKPIV